MSLRTWLLGVAGVGLLGFVTAGGLSQLGVHVSPLVTATFGMLSILAPTTLSWVSALRVGRGRPEAVLAAAAVTSWTAGGIVYSGLLVAGGSVSFPTMADLGSVLFYALMAAAVLMAVSRRSRGAAASVWWDAVVGALGAAAVLAVILDPILSPAMAGKTSLATSALAVFPVCDLLLLASVAGISAVRGVRMGRRWALLVAGLVVFAVADVGYSLQTASGTYVPGTLWDSAWMVGITLIAVWVGGPGDAESSARTRSANGAVSLAVSSGATLAALGVLLVSTLAPVPTVALVLAVMTLLAAVGRAEVAIRRLTTLAALRRRASVTDELTGLPNRRALTAEGQSRIAAQRGRPQAVLVVDLDKFKEVNDSLGHHVGDQLLVRVGARLSEQLSDGDLLARLGSDEFAVLLDRAGHDEAVEGAVRLRAALQEPFDLLDIALHSSVSIGIALYPGDGTDLSTLLSKADKAMYKAKGTLPGYHVYCSAHDADDARLQTVEELRTALTTGQLVLYYQPKIDLDTGDVRSVEALVRWDHPTRGLLYPDAFLALVEEFGLMPSLTHVVLELALDQAAVWSAQGRPMTVAVNLSASCLADGTLPDRVISMLAARGVPPSGLQLEITEEFLMADRDRARAILVKLRDNGVQISVDDFGTGYSSLSYLLDLPVDELKLDRSLVVTMVEDGRAAALVASTITLAHSLDLRMVAEGVETEPVLSELRRLGCDQAQGYFMSKPVPAAELNRWLVDRFGPDLSADVASPPSLVHLERGQ